MRPTKRAIALAGGSLALFAVGTNVQAGWVLAIAALLAGVFVTGLFLPIRGLAGLDVTRHVPRTAHAGHPVEVALLVTNSGRRFRGLVKITDDFCGSAGAVVPLIGPGTTREVRGVRTGARRGVYTTGECTLETGFPFGVLRVRRTKELTSPIVVYPVVYDVGASRTGGSVGLVTAAPYGDVSSVRDYQRGDPLRNIHWRSVAKRGHLVVREFDTEVRGEVVLAAEVGADRDEADAIATVACSLAIAALRDGSRVELVSARGRVEARTPSDVLDWGARLDAGKVRYETLVASRAVTVVRSGWDLSDLRGLASQTSLRVVVVGDSTDGSSLAADVVSVGAGKIESWLANAYIAS